MVERLKKMEEDVQRSQEAVAEREATWARIEKVYKFKKWGHEV